MTASTAFKVLTQQQWADFERERVFRGAPVDIADGYIHLSTAEQLEATIAKYFAGQGCLMIAEVAKVLGTIKTDDEGRRESEPAVVAVEAGTGTGQTVAYSLAAIPTAKAAGKRLVIATATVALQEQIVHKDLPDLMRNSGLNFSFALAKGRWRYLCLSKLDLLLVHEMF